MTIKKNASTRADLMCRLDQRQNTLFEKVAATVNDIDDPKIASCLEATFGRGASLNCLLASNGVERIHLASRMASKAGSQAKVNGHEMALVTFRDRSWSFDPEASILDLPLVRRVTNKLKKLGTSSIGVAQIGCLPSLTHRFEFVPQVKAVVFGRDLKLLLPGAVHKLQRNFHGFPGEKPIVIDWLDDRPERERYRQVAELFDMHDPFKAVVAASAVGSQAEWRADRVERVVRRYQMLTMCLIDKLVMATGELAPILEGALREGTSRARKLYMTSDKPLHRDQVVHFWLEQQVRRGQLFVLPFVKVR